MSLPKSLEKATTIAVSKISRTPYERPSPKFWNDRRWLQLMHGSFAVNAAMGHNNGEVAILHEHTVQEMLHGLRDICDLRAEAHR